MPGPKLKEIDRGWRKIKRRIFKLGPDAVLVGVQGSKAAEKREGGVTNVTVAAVHEFGSPSKNIRQRSFLGSTFDENKKKYLRQLNRLGRDLVTGKTTRAAGLNLLGEGYKGDVIAKITRGKIRPKLAPATVARRDAGPRDWYNPESKTENIPLFDTGQLVDSIRSVLEK